MKVTFDLATEAERMYQLANLLRRVAITPDCWHWKGWRDPDGYGRTYVAGTRKRAGAHRLAYELLVGPIPEGMVIDHLCGTRHCVNPAHMEPVTNGENSLRGDGPPACNRRKTHCKQGHAFDAENTYIDNHGRRNCRACRRKVVVV